MKARFLALAALVLGLASCQNDPEVDGFVTVGGEVDFQLAVSADELATRAGDSNQNQAGRDSAFGAIDYLQGSAQGDACVDWAEVDLRYTLEVYDYDKNEAYGDEFAPIKDRQVIVVDEYESVVFDLRLVPHRKYHFVVFADFIVDDKINDPAIDVNNPAIEVQRELGLRHTIGATLKDITIKADALNDEVADAYFATKDIEISNSATQDIELKRPYGKVRVIATDLAELNLNVDPGKVEVAYNAFHPNKFNALTGKASGVYEQEVYAFKYADDVLKSDLSEHVYTAGYDNRDPYSYENANGEVRHTHMTLFTDYILTADEAQKPYQFSMRVSDKNGKPIKTTHFNTDIPVQRNHLTTIIGNVLTTATEIEVTIDDNFANKDNWQDKPFYQTVWDGESMTVPAYDDVAKTYTIDEASDLAWLAAAVNGTLEETRAIAADSFVGKTFVLESDINLNNEPWTPIGTSANPFKGIFDGNNKTIANLFVDGGSESNKGLFGFTIEGEVKNLTIDNAKVSGRLNIGVVAGTPYTSKYTNIKVMGHVEVDGMAYVGAVGGKNAYADWTNVTVNVDKTSYVKAHSIENGNAYRTYVGGVVGFNGEGGHTFMNIRSNIDVKGSTCDVGGLFGIAHYSNKFKDCVCTGDVEIYAAEEAEEAQEIGGIAGVWHNENGTTVEFTDCVFDGELKTNIEGVEFYYGGLVGKPYSETGTGKLKLNGLEFDKNGVNFATINDALAVGNEYVMPYSLTGKAAASNAYGVTGINQVNGGTLNGAGYTLKVTGAGSTWGTAISTTGGTIKNITVAQGFRGIFVNHNSSNSEEVILENVVVDGPTYTISCDQGMNQGLKAFNSTFKGWTSYAGTIGEVEFTNCTFGAGAGNNFSRPYAVTLYVGCNFEEGHKMDPRAAVTFINCTYAGEALTPANMSELIISNAANAKFTDEKGNVIVNDIEDIKEAISVAGATVNVLAGEYTFPSSSVAEGVTIVCEEGTVFTGNSKLNIKGATVVGATFSNPAGTAVDQTINGKFVDCTFTGSNALRYCYAGDTCVFENCVFSGGVYGVHFDGGSKNVTFRNCEISGFNAFAAAIPLVTFEECSFVGNGTGYNGANLWGNAKFDACEFTFDGSTANEWIDCIKVDGEYSFDNCTINGVAYTAENYTAYDAIFSRNNATVNINGTDCAM